MILLARSVVVVVGFVDGMGLIFFKAKGELFKMDLKTNQATTRKVCEVTGLHTVVPYMSFHSLQVHSFLLI